MGKAPQVNSTKLFMGAAFVVCLLINIILVSTLFFGGEKSNPGGGPMGALIFLLLIGLTLPMIATGLIFLGIHFKKI